MLKYANTDRIMEANLIRSLLSHYTPEVRPGGWPRSYDPVIVNLTYFPVAITDVVSFASLKCLHSQP